MFQNSRALQKDFAFFAELFYLVQGLVPLFKFHDLSYFGSKYLASTVQVITYCLSYFFSFILGKNIIPVSVKEETTNFLVLRIEAVSRQNEVFFREVANNDHKSLNRKTVKYAA